MDNWIWLAKYQKLSFKTCLHSVPEVSVSFFLKLPLLLNFRLAQVWKDGQDGGKMVDKTCTLQIFKNLLQVEHCGFWPKMCM